MRIKRYLSILVFVFASIAAVGMARAQTPGGPLPGGIEVVHAWSRATAGTGSGVVYLTVTNHGTADDAVTGAQSPAAKMAHLHISAEKSGIMTMRPVTSVTVKAGQSVEFKPEGLHIMLMGLEHPLAAGDTFPLTLTFEKAGAVQTTVTVEKAGDVLDGPHGMPGMNMK